MSRRTLSLAFLTVEACRLLGGRGDLDTATGHIRAAFQRGATLHEVASAACLPDPPAVLGLDDLDPEVVAELLPTRDREVRS